MPKFMLGVQILRYYFEDLARKSKHFEVFGPHGGPVISEGVKILQHYSEVIGPGVQILRRSWTGEEGGNYLRGVNFFRDRRLMRKVRWLDL